MSSVSYPKSDVKSIVIGVLVAYVCFELLYCYSSRARSPAIELAASAVSTSSGMMACVMAIAFGALAWYLFSRIPCRQCKNESQ